MKTYIAFLRAVNVGGTGKLPMAELKAMCLELGFVDVTTYIASGNLVLKTDCAAGEVQQKLEGRLQTYAGKPVGVIVHTPDSLGDILDGNPFIKEEPSKVLTILLERSPPADVLDNLRGQKNEQVALGKNAIYAWYPDGMGRSKLKIPGSESGTARNINTLRKMLSLAG